MIDLQSHWIELDNKLQQIAGHNTEMKEKKEISNYLKSLGMKNITPVVVQTKLKDNRLVRIYIWKNSPIGNVGLVTGNNIEPSLHFLVQENENYENEQIDLQVVFSGVTYVSIPIPHTLERRMAHNSHSVHHQSSYDTVYTQNTTNTVKRTTKAIKQKSKAKKQVRKNPEPFAYNGSVPSPFEINAFDKFFPNTVVTKSGNLADLSTAVLLESPYLIQKGYNLAIIYDLSDDGNQFDITIQLRDMKNQDILVSLPFEMSGAETSTWVTTWTALADKLIPFASSEFEKYIQNPSAYQLPTSIVASNKIVPIVKYVHKDTGAIETNVPLNQIYQYKIYDGDSTIKQITTESQEVIIPSDDEMIDINVIGAEKDTTADIQGDLERMVANGAMDEKTVQETVDQIEQSFREPVSRRVSIDTDEIKEFKKYLLEIYGMDGLDPIGGFESVFHQAVDLYVSNPQTNWNSGDSVDREFVRDIALHLLGHSQTEYDVSKWLPKSSRTTVQPRTVARPAIQQQDQSQKIRIKYEFEGLQEEPIIPITSDLLFTLDDFADVKWTTKIDYKNLWWIFAKNMTLKPLCDRLSKLFVPKTKDIGKAIISSEWCVTKINSTLSAGKQDKTEMIFGLSTTYKKQQTKFYGSPSTKSPTITPKTIELAFGITSQSNGLRLRVGKCTNEESLSLFSPQEAYRMLMPLSQFKGMHLTDVMVAFFNMVLIHILSNPNILAKIGEYCELPTSQTFTGVTKTVIQPTVAPRPVAEPAIQRIATQRQVDSTVVQPRIKAEPDTNDVVSIVKSNAKEWASYFDKKAYIAKNNNEFIGDLLHLWSEGIKNGFIEADNDVFQDATNEELAEDSDLPREEWNKTPYNDPHTTTNSWVWIYIDKYTNGMYQEPDGVFSNIVKYIGKEPIWNKNTTKMKNYYQSILNLVNKYSEYFIPATRTDRQPTRQSTTRTATQSVPITYLDALVDSDLIRKLTSVGYSIDNIIYQKMNTIDQPLTSDLEIILKSTDNVISIKFMYYKEIKLISFELISNSPSIDFFWSDHTDFETFSNALEKMKTHLDYQGIFRYSTVAPKPVTQQTVRPLSVDRTSWDTTQTVSDRLSSVIPQFEFIESLGQISTTEPSLTRWYAGSLAYNFPKIENYIEIGLFAHYLPFDNELKLTLKLLSDSMPSFDDYFAILAKVEQDPNNTEITEQTWDIKQAWTNFLSHVFDLAGITDSSINDDEWIIQLGQQTTQRVARLAPVVQPQTTKPVLYPQIFDDFFVVKTDYGFLISPKKDPAIKITFNLLDSKKWLYDLWDAMLNDKPYNHHNMELIDGHIFQQTLDGVTSSFGFDPDKATELIEKMAKVAKIQLPAKPKPAPRIQTSSQTPQSQLVDPMPFDQQMLKAKKLLSQPMNENYCPYLKQALSALLPYKINVKKLDGVYKGNFCNVSADITKHSEINKVIQAIRTLGFQTKSSPLEKEWVSKENNPQDWKDMPLDNVQFVVFPAEYVGQPITVDFNQSVENWKLTQAPQEPQTAQQRQAPQRVATQSYDFEGFKQWAYDGGYNNGKQNKYKAPINEPAFVATMNAMLGIMPNRQRKELVALYQKGWQKGYDSLFQKIEQHVSQKLKLLIDFGFIFKDGSKTKTLGFEKAFDFSLNDDSSDMFKFMEFRLEIPETPKDVLNFNYQKYSDINLTSCKNDWSSKKYQDVFVSVEDTKIGMTFDDLDRGLFVLVMIAIKNFNIPITATEMANLQKLAIVSFKKHLMTIYGSKGKEKYIDGFESVLDQAINLFLDHPAKTFEKTYGDTFDTARVRDIAKWLLGDKNIDPIVSDYLEQKLKPQRQAPRPMAQKPQRTFTHQLNAFNYNSMALELKNHKEDMHSAIALEVATDEYNPFDGYNVRLVVMSITGHKKQPKLFILPLQYERMYDKKFMQIGYVDWKKSMIVESNNHTYLPLLYFKKSVAYPDMKAISEFLITLWTTNAGVWTKTLLKDTIALNPIILKLNISAIDFVDMLTKPNTLFSHSYQQDELKDLYLQSIAQYNATKAPIDFDVEKQKAYDLGYANGQKSIYPSLIDDPKGNALVLSSYTDSQYQVLTKAYLKGWVAGSSATQQSQAPQPKPRFKSGDEITITQNGAKEIAQIQMVKGYDSDIGARSYDIVFIGGGKNGQHGNVYDPSNNYVLQLASQDKDWQALKAMVAKSQQKQAQATVEPPQGSTGSLGTQISTLEELIQYPDGTLFVTPDQNNDLEIRVIAKVDNELYGFDEDGVGMPLAFMDLPDAGDIFYQSIKIDPLQVEKGYLNKQVAVQFVNNAIQALKI